MESAASRARLPKGLGRDDAPGQLPTQGIGQDQGQKAESQDSLSTAAASGSASAYRNTFQELTNMLLETDLMIDNTTSEPRDILMTERTALSWVKFSITLAAIAITIVTNFRLDTSGDNDSGDRRSPPWVPRFSYGVSILFILLSMATLFVGCLSYFQSIYNYKANRVNTYSLKTTLGFLFVVGLVLLAVNIVFVVAVEA